VLHVTEVPGYEYIRVADDIERRIRSGEYAPGVMLPGERAMAEEQGVAIGTVRRAIAELRARELVVTLPAKGTYVAAQAD
jgi:GntR family transcriptional regulator